MRIFVTDLDGVTHECEGIEGWRVMEIIRDAGLPIKAECGGCASCATCHVYVEGDWFEKVGPPDDIEYAMLDMVTDVLKDNSRLCCQIKMKAELDGIEVTVAPTSGI